MTRREKVWRATAERLAYELAKVCDGVPEMILENARLVAEEAEPPCQRNAVAMLSPNRIVLNGHRMKEWETI